MIMLKATREILMFYDLKLIVLEYGMSLKRIEYFRGFEEVNWLHNSVGVALIHPGGLPRGYLTRRN